MKKVIQIASTNYSGSTMLDLMLSNDDRGFSCGEMYAMFRPWRPYHLHPRCRCGNPGCDIWERVRAYGEEKVYESIFKLCPQVDFIVDSSKFPIWLKDQQRYLRQSNLQCINVLIWKDPLEYAYACFKRRQIKGWKERWISYHKKCISITPHWCSVRYRDLAQAPAETLAGLCEAIEIDYYPGKEFFWERRQHTLWGSASVSMHLQEKGSEAFSGMADVRALEKPNIDQQEILEIKQHREIYYDGNYRQKLPVEIITNAQNDSELNDLVNILEMTDFRRLPDRDDIKIQTKDIRVPVMWYTKDKMLNRVYGVAARAGIQII